MATVEIGENSYQTYADTDAADEYLEADFNASAWRGATDDEKARALVSATRVLDRVTWAGDKAESDQALAWPRTDTNIDGVEDDEVPTDIVNASIELANAILIGTDVANQTQAQNVKRQAAGSVSIEYFRAFDDPARFPLSVQELIQRFLGGSTAAILPGAIATGTDKCSDFSRSYEPSQGF